MMIEDNMPDRHVTCHPFLGVMISAARGHILDDGEESSKTGQELCLTEMTGTEICGRLP